MKRYLAILSLLLIGISCAKQETQPDKPSKTIQLSVDVLSRGVTSTTDNIREFISFGYQQDTKLWKDVLTTATPNLMWKNKYTRASNDWIGETQTEWPDNAMNKYYAFFAYSPEASTQNKITLLTSATTAGYQQLSYETLSDVESQVDLVVASKVNQSPSSVVQMSFLHMLTRVGFTAFSNIVGTKVNWISINGMKYKGKLNVQRDASWANIEADRTNFKVELNPAVAVSSDKDKPTDLTGSGRYYFLMLPQDLTANTNTAICITFNYTQMGVEITKDYVIKENLAKGRSTIYEVDLSGVANADLIVSEVIITDWIFGDMNDMDVNDGTAEYQEFTVTYNANGGSGSPTLQKIKGKDSFVVLAKPTSAPSADHDFIGYNTQTNGNGTTYQPGASIPISANITLYAKWATNYVETAGLHWAVGNLVADGAGGCKMGTAEDGGLYFQFGSLISWKGGATGDGTGRGAYKHRTYFTGRKQFHHDEVATIPPECTKYSMWNGWPTGDVNMFYIGRLGNAYNRLDLANIPNLMNGGLAVDGIGDACRYYLGGSWRTPTAIDIRELIRLNPIMIQYGKWEDGSVNSYVIIDPYGVKLRFNTSGFRSGQTGGMFYHNGRQVLIASSTTATVYRGTGNMEAGTALIYTAADRNAALPVRCVKNK